MTSVELHDLLRRIQSATGRDHQIDLDIAHHLGGVTAGQEVPEYTASADLCFALIDHVLPGWHWHVGYGPRGIFPYASVAKKHIRFEAQASTVPLALLTALLKARLSDAWS